jgi:hypothetical protein
MKPVVLAAVLVLAVLAGGVWLVLQPPAAPPAETAGVNEPEPEENATARRRVRAPPRERPERLRRDPLESAFARVQAAEHDGRFLEALELLLRLRREHPARFADGEHDDWLRTLERAAVEEVTAAVGELSTADARDLVLRALELVREAAARQSLRRLAMQLSEDVAAREEVVVAGAESEEDRDALATHLAHFGPAVPGVDRRVPDGPLTTLLQRVRSAAATRSLPVEPLPVADLEASEQRRLDQLDKLRQRDAVGLLDPIHAGLAWLALHQADDGSFSDDATKARCEELGHAESCVAETGRYPLAPTALAALAILDFRDQDARGLFEPTLSAAVTWLRSQIQENGSFRQHAYEAPIALMALGQAASSSGDPEVLADLERAWKYYAGEGVVGPGGGYRYSRGQAGDLSITGWYVQAYEAARDAEAELPPTLKQNLHAFVRSAWDGDTTFAYVPGKTIRPTMMPVGMLSLWVLDQAEVESRREAWAESLKSTKRPSNVNLYVLYYDVRMELALRGDLAQHRRTMLDDFAELYQTADGDALGRFNTQPDKKRTKALMKRDKRRDVLRGQDGWFRRGGTTLYTAFSVLTLEHALYRR